MRVKATGTSKGVSRTLTARLSPNSFLQYIYHTDKEDLDPVLYNGVTAAVQAQCNQYYYAVGLEPGPELVQPRPLHRDPVRLW